MQNIELLHKGYPNKSVLQRELNGLDGEFSVLKFLSQELQFRAPLEAALEDVSIAG